MKDITENVSQGEEMEMTRFRSCSCPDGRVRLVPSPTMINLKAKPYREAMSDVIINPREGKSKTTSIHNVSKKAFYIQRRGNCKACARRPSETHAASEEDKIRNVNILR